MPCVDKEKKKAYDLAWKRANNARVNELARISRSKRREQFNAAARKYSTENKEHIELLRIVRTYQISKEEFLALKEERQGSCGVCGIKAKLHVDHCHTTGKVRSLLCGNCNWGLGHFQDSPELLRKAANYIETHNA